jgi:hypothetical protein
MTHIGVFKTLGCVLSILFDAGFSIFYTYAYSTITDGLRLDTPSIIFAIYIGVRWIQIIFTLKPLFVIIKYYGETIDDDVWKLLSAQNRWDNFCCQVLFGLSIYFMIVIGPFFDSCGIYGDSVACVALQMIAFFGFLEACFIALFLLFVMCSCMCACFDICEAITQNTRIDDVPVFQLFGRYNPLPKSTTQCGLCLKPVDEEYTILNCDHIHHRDCLSKWFVYSQTCPHCRRYSSLTDESYII